jgi:FlaA1/EpsC-like NDP-sugar epimerase
MDLSIMSAVAVALFLLSPIGNGTGSSNLYPLFFNLLIWYLCIIVFQLIFHTYDSLWKYAQGKEYLFLLLGFGCGTILYLVLTKTLFSRQLAGLYMISVLGSSLIIMLFIRFEYRSYRDHRSIVKNSNNTASRKTAIIGAGDAGISLLREMVRKENCPYLPSLMLDDDPTKIGMKVTGVPIRGPLDNIPELLKETEIKELILAIPSCSLKRRREILALCTQTDCRLRILPDRVRELSLNKSLMSSMRNVQIEDLLEREPIQLEIKDSRKMIENKTVLVTGGGGSIGSELCRQIAAMNPSQLIILDNYENSTYELQQELLRMYGQKLKLSIEIVTIQDSVRIQHIFQSYHPDFVFHAAAHKHVPLMEESPAEAVKNNVFGTFNVVQAAHKTGVKKFVLISTDKAVNPTSVMGATKRLCEMILSSMRDHSKTDFVAVRFGNVLGSNGSVIPLFQKQIAEGGPVTITDKRIVRYFMTISEAVSLVLQASAMAKSSEVFVLDMGKPVHILDLAENMIRLSGYEPYTEIPIVEIGLRKGEKLFEELLVGGKDQQKTKNKSIYIEEEQTISQQKLLNILKEMKNAVLSDQDELVLEALHNCVPEFMAPEEVNRAHIEACNIEMKPEVSFAG